MKRAMQSGMMHVLRMKLKGVEDSNKLIREKAIKEKVLLLPGGEFMPNGSKSAYIRAAYSTASEVEMEEAMKRLGRILSQQP